MADFELRPLAHGDAPALQAVYDQMPELFARLLGHPAPAGQAARDLGQAQDDTRRFIFGVFVEDQIVGVVDCRLADDDPTTAHVGLLALARPYDDPAIAGLALRILVRWLAGEQQVRRLTTAIPAQDAGGIAFWQTQGFAFTGQQYRRQLVDYAPRFLVMARDLP